MFLLKYFFYIFVSKIFFPFFKKLIFFFKCFFIKYEYGIYDVVTYYGVLATAACRL